MTKQKLRRGLIMFSVTALSVGMLAGSADAGPKGKRIGKLSAKQCQQERRAMGNATFRQTYGQAPFKRCLGVNRPEVRSDLNQSFRDCRTERREMTAEAFRAKYGTNKNLRNAFGKCVSRKVRADVRENRRDNVNAARACKAERSELGGGPFRDQYGTNANKRNAFGKCVSAKANATDTD